MIFIFNHILIMAEYSDYIFVLPFTLDVPTLCKPFYHIKPTKLNLPEQYMSLSLS
jgi:hypothetical protein